MPGAETNITRYPEGCAAGGAAELWTIVGGGHVPVLSASFDTLVLDFLFGADGPTIFNDDFESGDLSAWSAVVF